MSKKVSPPLRIAPLQRVSAQPITDPVEQATLDELRKPGRRKQRGQGAKMNRNGARSAPSSPAKRRG